MGENIILNTIWSGIALGLLWLPLVALLLAVFSLFHTRLRPQADAIWSVALGTTLCGFWGLGPSLLVAASTKPDWNVLFHSTLGVAGAGISQGICGMITGAYVGWLFSRCIVRVRKTSFPWSVFLLLLMSAVSLFFCYLPAAAIEDWLGGGSGYGQGVPPVFMWVFESFYFPVFRRMIAAGMTLVSLSTYSPVFLCVTGPLIVFILGSQRILKTFRNASESTV